MFLAMGVLGVLSILIALTGSAVIGTVMLLGITALFVVVDIFLLPFGVGAPLDVLVSHPVEIALLSGLALLPVLYLSPVRREIREFREELGAAGRPAAETHPEVAAITRRLATQAGIPEPDVYVTDRRRAESYAVGGRPDGTIVLTTGLVSQLSTDEVTAVLAHEISHLVNGDSRLVGVALVPMLLAAEIGSDERPSVEWALRSPLGYLFSLAAWAVVTVVTRAQRLSSQLGVAVISREREFAADRGAAKLTGSPGALAAALGKLDDTRRPPSEDKRTWSEAAAALDILPREESIAGDGPFRTHPETAQRIQRLEQLTVGIEEGRS